jgi:hypothetical protein
LRWQAPRERPLRQFEEAIMKISVNAPREGISRKPIDNCAF